MHKKSTPKVLHFVQFKVVRGKWDEPIYTLSNNIRGMAEMYRNLHIFTYPPLCNEPFLNPPLQTRREFRNSWKRNLKGKFTTTIDPSIDPCKIDFTPIPPQLSITPKLFQSHNLDNLQLKSPILVKYSKIVVYVRFS